MRLISQMVFVIILCELLTFCSGGNEQSRILTPTDSLWLNFATAMDQNNLEFLLLNSSDSIRCVDCEPVNSTRESETYKAEYLFINRLSELMHLDNLSTTDFSTFLDSTSIKVNYSIKTRNAPEGGYNLIFVLEKRNGKYLLNDRFFVP